MKITIALLLLLVVVVPFGCASTGTDLDRATIPKLPDGIESLPALGTLVPDATWCDRDKLQDADQKLLCATEWLTEMDAFHFPGKPVRSVLAFCQTFSVGQTETCYVREQIKGMPVFIELNTCNLPPIAARIIILANREDGDVTVRECALYWDRDRSVWRMGTSGGGFTTGEIAEKSNK